MSQTTVEIQLADFATGLVENCGGIVDWEPDRSQATAVVPETLAESLGQHDDTFLVSAQPSDDGLFLSLGGEFIDLAGRTMKHFIPAIGTFAVADIPIRKTEFAALVESSFGWQNVRAKVKDVTVVTVPYHAWWFHVKLQSEETWESLVSVTVNAQSMNTVALGEPLDLIGLRSVDEHRKTAPLSDLTFAPARQFVEEEVLRKAAPFLERIDARRERDRKRLKEYYQAMLRESSSSHSRVKLPTPDEIESRTKAVKLELQRKLGELDERYCVNAILRPVILAELNMPAVTIDVAVQRKSQTRTIRLYWNSLLKGMEPLACSQCGRSS